jgi:hypothetical protein
MTSKEYTVIRDNQEKINRWTFDNMVEAHLETGDYTLRGYESTFVIEKKSSTGEFAGNIVQPRFERELERLETFAHPFVICEFTMEDIYKFPCSSGIPSHLWKNLRVSSHFMVKKLLEYQLNYKTKFILAGSRGREVALSLFKRIIAHG